MDINLFWQGLGIGLAIAAPVGVIGILCIHRTLTQGQLIGFGSGLGAATADACYGAIAAFGLTFITQFLLGQQFWLRLGGGLFLGYLGVQTFREKPHLNDQSESSQLSLTQAYLSTFFLTLTNPLTIFSFLGIFAGLGLGKVGLKYEQAIWLVIGVFLGSALWWLILSGTVTWLRDRFKLTNLFWLNRIAGTIILTFGLLALLSIARSM